MIPGFDQLPWYGQLLVGPIGALAAWGMVGWALHTKQLRLGREYQAQADELATAVRERDEWQQVALRLLATSAEAQSALVSLLTPSGSRGIR